MTEEQINKIKKRADEYATACFPYENQSLEREAVVKCCVKVVEEATKELQEELKIQKHNTHTVAYLGDCIEDIQDKKIAEAKEIIKTMFPIFKDYFLNQSIENYKGNVDYIDTLKRAEQFISEVEK